MRTELIEHISVTRAAQVLDVTTAMVRKQIKDGKLRARRVGRLWRLPVDQFEDVELVEDVEGAEAC